jgi:hypothetical protein
VPRFTEKRSISSVISDSVFARKKCKTEANRSWLGISHLEAGRRMNFQEFLKDEE